MATATCPECDAEVEVDEVDADIGDEVSCPECGQNLVVSGTEPIELDFADEDEEDDDESDDDDDLDDGEDLEDEDEDEEREEEDWEE
jgi:ribonuclease E